jgi:hypothetical protein
MEMCRCTIVVSVFQRVEAARGMSERACRQNDRGGSQRATGKQNFQDRLCRCCEVNGTA